MTIEEMLEERGATHGDFTEHAAVTQGIKAVFRKTRNWLHLDPVQQESLEMFAHKIGRILAGNPNHPDHWDDIAGYARLVSERLPGSAHREPTIDELHKAAVDAAAKFRDRLEQEKQTASINVGMANADQTAQADLANALGQADRPFQETDDRPIAGMPEGPQGPLLQPGQEPGAVAIPTDSEKAVAALSDALAGIPVPTVPVDKPSEQEGSQGITGSLNAWDKPTAPDPDTAEAAVTQDGAGKNKPNRLRS